MPISKDLHAHKNVVAELLPINKGVFQQNRYSTAHPDDRDVSIDDQTWSDLNMAGKTTFLRTLGVNAVLAQTIYTCLAASYTANYFRIRFLRTIRGK